MELLIHCRFVGGVVKEAFWEKEEPSKGGACAMIQKFDGNDVDHDEYLWASETCADSHHFICEMKKKYEDKVSHEEEGIGK